MRAQCALGNSRAGCARTDAALFVYIFGRFSLQFLLAFLSEFCPIFCLDSTLLLRPSQPEPSKVRGASPVAEQRETSDTARGRVSRGAARGKRQAAGRRRLCGGWRDSERARDSSQKHRSTTGALPFGCVLSGGKIVANLLAHWLLAGTHSSLLVGDSFHARGWRGEWAKERSRSRARRRRRGASGSVRRAGQADWAEQRQCVRRSVSGRAATHCSWDGRDEQESSNLVMRLAGYWAHWAHWAHWAERERLRRV